MNNVIHAVVLHPAVLAQTGGPAVAPSVTLTMAFAKLAGFVSTIVSSLVPLTVLITCTAALVYIQSRFAMKPEGHDVGEHQVFTLANKFLATSASIFAAAIGFAAGDRSGQGGGGCQLFELPLALPACSDECQQSHALPRERSGVTGRLGGIRAVECPDRRGRQRAARCPQTGIGSLMAA
jgi:hypothetical protein